MTESVEIAALFFYFAKKRVRGMLGWVIYGITVNVIAFCLMGYDKNRARTGRWRVSERKLFLVGIIGGSIGIYFGMKKNFVTKRSIAALL